MDETQSTEVCTKDSYRHIRELTLELTTNYDFLFLNLVGISKSTIQQEEQSNST